jgi:hypothetical protein
MRFLCSIIALAALVTSSVTLASSDSPLMVRMIALNAGLRSYEAAIHADITMKTFPFLNPSLDGTYYHKEPGMDKIVFTSGVPSMAEEFSKIYPHVPSPSQWDSVYIVKQGRDDGQATAFTLVPRKHGRVDHIDVSVDDASATVLFMRWNYDDGGYAELHQTFSNVNGNLLVTGQTGHFDSSLYKADVTSTLTNYKLNPPLSDTFFQDQ